MSANPAEPADRLRTASGATGDGLGGAPPGLRRAERGAADLPQPRRLIRRCIALPVLKYSTVFAATDTAWPVRRLRPIRAVCCLVPKTPKPRSSTR
jgi:hypothetical protein